VPDLRTIHIRSLGFDRVINLEREGRSQEEISEILNAQYQNWTDQELENAFMRLGMNAVAKQAEDSHQSVLEWREHVNALRKKGLSDDQIRTSISKELKLADTDDMEVALNRMGLETISKISRPEARINSFFLGVFGLSWVGVLSAWVLCIEVCVFYINLQKSTFLTLRTEL